jgi:hypothetical protein
VAPARRLSTAVAHAVFLAELATESREPTANDALFVPKLPSVFLVVRSLSLRRQLKRLDHVRDAVSYSNERLRRPRWCPRAVHGTSTPTRAFDYDFALADFDNDGLGELASHDAVIR